MSPSHELVTPSTVDMSPERRAEYVQQSREELQHLSRQGYHACGWALEAIDTLTSDLHRCRSSILFQLQNVPVPKDGPHSPLQIANPVKPKKRPPFKAG